MKNTASISLCLIAAAGLGAWGGWEHHLRLKAEKQLSSVSRECDILRETANKKVALGSKTNVSPEGPEGLGPEHAEALKAEQEKGRDKDKDKNKDTIPKEGAQIFDEVMDQMLNDPSRHETLKTQMRGLVGYFDRDLMDMLKRPPDKQDRGPKTATD